MGSSEEIGASSYSTPDGSFNSGYYVSAKDKFLMTGEIVNYTNETKDIYTVSEVEYIDGRPDGMLDTDVVVLNVNQCISGDLALHPPEGKKKFSFGSPEMTVEKAGYIMSRRRFGLSYPSHHFTAIGTICYYFNGTATDTSHSQILC
jgi:hypothetical protein